MPTINYEDCSRCVGQACQAYIKYASWLAMSVIEIRAKDPAGGINFVIKPISNFVAGCHYCNLSCTTFYAISLPSNKNSEKTPLLGPRYRALFCTVQLVVPILRCLSLSILCWLLFLRSIFSRYSSLFFLIVLLILSASSFCSSKSQSTYHACQICSLWRSVYCTVSLYSLVAISLWERIWL